MLKIPGIESLHELHVWRLDERKTIASVHVVVSDKSVSNFIKTAKHINECLHAYGIHSTTLQPELAVPPHAVTAAGTVNLDGAAALDSISPPAVTTGVETSSTTSSKKRAGSARQGSAEGCQLICTSLCGSLMCCNLPT
jgi:solute carrier family 30 (zinc transporter), member 1